MYNYLTLSGLVRLVVREIKQQAFRVEQESVTARRQDSADFAGCFNAS